MVDLVVAGLVAFDDISTPAGSVSRVVGGAGCYTTVAASMFCKTGLVGIAGSDFSEGNKQLLRSKGVDLAGLQTVGDKTFYWKGKYEGDWNNAITLDTQLNALTKFKPDVPESYREAKHVFLTNLDPELQLAFMAKAKGIVAMDTMNYWIDSKPKALREAIAKADILFVNDAEARQITGEKELKHAAEQLAAMGPSQVVIKLGANGAMLYNSDGHKTYKAYKLEQVVDPTGCGDSFAGAVMGCLAAGKTMREAMLYGTAVASFNAEGFGLERLKAITHSDIDARVAKLRA